jgi:hypothetical protein
MNKPYKQKRKTTWPVQGYLLSACLLLCFSSNSALAQSGKRNTQADDDESFIERIEESAVNSAIKSHEAIGKSYLWLTRNIDNYFADEANEGLVDESYLRLELKSTFRKSGERVNDARLKAKVDLPGTKQRLKLVFDSENKEDTNQQTRISPVSTGRRIERESSVAGLEYVSEKDPLKWRMSTSAGARLRSTLVPYARIKWKKRTPIGDGWYSDFTQAIRYFDDKGLSEYTQMEFIRPISSTLELRQFNEIEYRDRENRFDFASTVSIIQSINQMSGIEYRAGGFGNSEGEREVDSYFLGTTYSQRLTKESVFLTISPQLSFSRDNDWNTDPSLTFQLDIYFR